MKTRIFRLTGVTLCALLMLTAGCVRQQAFVRAEALMQQGDYDAAVEEYFAAVRENPDREEFRMKLANARSEAAWLHLERGREQSAGGNYPDAISEFRLAQGLDPSLSAAGEELQAARARLQAERLVAEAEDFYRQRRFPQARKNLDEALLLAPGLDRAQILLEKVRSGSKTLMDGYELDVASDKPITLKFKDAEIRDVFDILSKLSGINFLFDGDLRSQKISVFLEDATFAQALQLLLQMNDLDKRVLNGKTLIIYEKTKDKEKQYQDQVIQTFYLSNIDAKKAVNLLRTMLQLRKIYVHEELNALVIRDNPEVIKLAQQIIEAADRADAEVVFELELVETSHGDDMNIGPKLQSYSTSFGYVTPGTTTLPSSGSITVGALDGLEFLYTIPTATFDLRKTLTDSEILANPKIRVKNKEKAKVHVGSREPVITVTTTGTDTRSDSIQYVDVGVKLEVEPAIQLDNSVVTKISLEVSNVTDRTTTENGTLALTISTTNASTALTLKDGETTVLGGLIRDDYSKTRNTIPVLGRLPLIGPMISGHERNKSKREILLSITPHIVKTLSIPRADVAQIWSGGEDDLKAGPNFAAFAEPLVPAQQQPAPTPVPGQATPEPLAPPVQAPPQLPVPVSPPVPSPAPPAQPAQPIVEGAGVPGADGDVAPPESGVGSESVPQVVLPPREAALVQTQGRVFARGPELVDVGEEFTVEVAVDGIQDLYSAPLFLAYPPELVDFVRAEEGTFFTAGGGTGIFTSSVNRDQGQLILGARQGAVGEGVSGAGVLARVVLRATKAGSGQIVPERINFRDPGGKRLPVEAAALSFEVR